MDGLKLYRFSFSFFISTEYIHKDYEFYVKSTNISEEEFFEKGSQGFEKVTVTVVTIHTYQND